MKRSLAMLPIAVLVAANTFAGNASAAEPAAKRDVRITFGSKSFTESVILGELAVLIAEREGFQANHRRQIGGTQLVWKGLTRGDIDVYPDYTGTISEVILGDVTVTDPAAMRQALAGHGVLMTDSLGFSNPYALGMRKERAEQLGIRRISDLANHPNLKFGFSNEFMQRGDGWPSLRQRYNLPQSDSNVRGLEHGLAYKALERGDLDVTDTYFTDPKINQYDLLLLEDDLSHFPKYETVYLYRQQLEQSAPEFVAGLKQLSGGISNAEMLAMNSRVELEKVSERRVAGEYLQIDVQVEQMWQRLLRNTWGHLFLVCTSLGAAIVVAIPLGVIAAKRPKLGHGILVTAEIVQTIPALALLVLLMPVTGSMGFGSIGPAPAIVALFFYSLLPIIRNTHAGITNIPGNIREAAAAIGLSPWAQLWQVELPMASRLILAGIKTTAVINVGYATLGGLISAGGYGQPIMQGLRLDDVWVMMQGAVPAALMALVVKGMFEWGERFLVPLGLRLKPAH